MAEDDTVTDQLKIDEEHGFHPRQHNGCLTSCKQFIYKISIVVGVILVSVGIIITIVMLVHYKEPTHNISSGSGIVSSLSGEQEQSKEYTQYCVLESDHTFLGTVGEELGELCKPMIVHSDDKEQKTDGTTTIKGQEGYWFKCHADSDEYVRLQCACDSEIHCQSSQFDQHSKHNCSTCRNANYCPCVYGTCKNCTDPRKNEEPKCNCKEGAEGKFCTKITKRICMKPKENDARTLDACESTNNKNCSVMINNTLLLCHFPYDTSVFKSAWNCHAEMFGESSVVLSTVKSIIGDADKQKIEEIQNDTNSFPMKIALGIQLVVLIVALCPLIFHIWWRRRNNIKDQNRHET